eukprot:scaffold3401_cov26-Tisochrysis_lutea.AAC.1
MPAIPRSQPRITSPAPSLKLMLPASNWRPEVSLPTYFTRTRLPLLATTPLPPPSSSASRPASRRFQPDGAAAPPPVPGKARKSGRGFGGASL